METMCKHVFPQLIVLIESPKIFLLESKCIELNDFLIEMFVRELCNELLDSVFGRCHLVLIFLGDSVEVFL